MEAKEALERYPYLEKVWKMRARVWAFIVWEESVDYDRLCSVISELHTPAVISPLHDLDTYTEADVDGWKKRHEGLSWVTDRAHELIDGEVYLPYVGEYKKPHYHVLVAWAGSKSYQQMWEYFSCLGIRFFQKVESKGGYIRYLVHLDDPDKAQYSIDNIHSFGGIDLSALVTISQIDKLEMMGAVLSYIYDNRITSFSHLARWAVAQPDPDVWTTVASSAVFFRAVISDYRWDLAQADKLNGRSLVEG